LPIIFLLGVLSDSELITSSEPDFLIQLLFLFARCIFYFVVRFTCLSRIHSKVLADSGYT
jgi:hypothetical protein